MASDSETVWTRLKGWLRAPETPGDLEKTNTARLLNGILLMVVVSSLVLLPVNVITGGISLIMLVIALVLMVAGLAGLVLLRLGYVRWTSFGFTFLMWAMCTYMVLRVGAIRSHAVGLYVLTIIAAGVLSGSGGLLVLTSLTIMGLLAFYVLADAGVIVEVPSAPRTGAQDVFGVSILLALAGLFLWYASRRNEQISRESRRFATELAESNAALLENQAQLESQAAGMQRRSAYLSATLVIAREATAAVGDPTRVMTRVVRLITEEFGFYHAGLFMLDESGEWAILQAASSEGGRRMLARGHRLRVGAQGLVGDVALSGRSRIALNVEEGAGDEALPYFNNPDLPETKSEIALPLRREGAAGAASAVIGVLDVQSTDPRAFSEEDIATLQGLADQVAVAVIGSRLFQQVQAAAASERRAFQNVSSQAWRNLLSSTQHELGFVASPAGVVPAGDLWRGGMMETLRSGRVVATNGRDGAPPSLTLPITVRGEVVGVIDARKPRSFDARWEGGDGAQDTDWSDEEIALAQAFTDQLQVALEGARLYEETQRSAARERLAREVTARMREPLEIEDVLRTAVGEIRRALDLESLMVQLTPVGLDDERKL